MEGEGEGEGEGEDQHKHKKKMSLSIIISAHLQTPINHRHSPHPYNTMSSLLLTPPPPLPLLSLRAFAPKTHSLSFSPNPRRLFSVHSYSSTDPPPKPESVDEWGEKSDPEPEPTSRFPDPDPAKDEDEWGGSGVEIGNGSPVTEDVVENGGGRLGELKRALVDTVYGSDLGFRVSSEIRAEVLELVSQLEAANPTPAPTECPDLLNGNWILVYTAFSELLPLLAASSIPFVKIEKITQSIDTSSLTIENSTTLSSPVSTLSFSAIASFEVRSPSRIQVVFKEGKFKPPEIKSNIDLPQEVNIFGQNISLSPLQQSLGPLQNGVEGISRAISGQPPLKVSIPGERTKSWLLITYLDSDFRISRGDGGVFVLVKEGSSLLD